MIGAAILGQRKASKLLWRAEKISAADWPTLRASSQSAKATEHG